jgi:NADH-quinone oxidoreductase subunit G
VNVGDGARWLGTSIASLSKLDRVLVVGSNLRKDHPLFAQRIRHSVRAGCAVSAINAVVHDWAMPVQHILVTQSEGWLKALAEVACAVAAQKGVPAPLSVDVGATATLIAKSLMSGERKAILLGNGAAHHGRASSLLALANWIGQQTGASVGYLTEAANTVGAQLGKAIPAAGGLNAAQMLAGRVKAAILLNVEPEFDSAASQAAVLALGQCQMVVSLNPFKANMAFADVILPIAPFTETPGTFINAEGRVQSFHAVVKPLGETRPGWKVLRVLGNMLGLSGFDFESAQDVSTLALSDAVREGNLVDSRLSNACSIEIDPADMADQEPGTSPAPVVASIYQLDGMVRRASSLQMTADNRVAELAT